MVSRPLEQNLELVCQLDLTIYASQGNTASPAATKNLENLTTSVPSVRLSKRLG